MLRKLFSLAILLTILLVAPWTVADSLTQWSGWGEIRLSGDNNYKAFFLDDLVYRYAAADLSDLRIVDQNGEFVPYLIQSGIATKEVTENSLHSVLQKSFRKRSNFYYDFAVILPDPNIDPVGTVLRIKLPEGEFLKEIDVYGSYDGKHWNYLVRDQLYIVENLIKNEVVLERREKYSFYRIKVLNNLERLEIRGLDLVDRLSVTDWSEYENETESEFEVKQEPKQTRLIIKNPNRLKIKRIRIDAEGNFKRAYKIVTGSDDEFTYKTGQIYNFQFNKHTVAKTDIDLSGLPYSDSKLKLIIVNHDDRPLSINGITINYYRDKVIFESKGNSSYRLLFGNPKAVKPHYDLEHFQSYLEMEAQDLVKVENYQVKPSNEGRHGINDLTKMVFNLIIGFVAILLLVFVIRKLNAASN